MRRPRLPKDLRRIRLRLRREGHPRLLMMLIVAITGGAGFVSSFLMLQVGISSMWIRYSIAVVIAYLVFLALLWFWLRIRREVHADLADPGLAPDLTTTTELPFSGKGGHGGGGGATESFDVAEPAGPLQSIELPSVGDAVSSAADAEEFAIPLVAIVLVAVVLVASIWAMVAVPVLVAELLLDGVLAGILYRRLRRLQGEHWLESAVRVTARPFVLTLVVAALCGWGMQWLAPDAHTIGQFFAQVTGR